VERWGGTVRIRGTHTSMFSPPERAMTGRDVWSVKRVQGGAVCVYRGQDRGRGLKPIIIVSFDPRARS
jgi:hypothetical protein